MAQVSINITSIPNKEKAIEIMRGIYDSYPAYGYGTNLVGSRCELTGICVVSGTRSESCD